MATSPPLSSWAEHALASLTRAGYRSGEARRAVVELLGRQSCGLTARDIDARLETEGRAVGRASVYRVLEQLDELGLVQRLDVGQGTARYEAAHPDGDHHHHLVCQACGRVAPFEDAALERAIGRVCDEVRFSVEAHDVVLRGRCEACRKTHDAPHTGASPEARRPPRA